jgi:hypothetical protein
MDNTDFKKSLLIDFQFPVYPLFSTGFRIIIDGIVMSSYWCNSINGCCWIFDGVTYVAHNGPYYGFHYTDDITIYKVTDFDIKSFCKTRHPKEFLKNYSNKKFIAQKKSFYDWTLNTGETITHSISLWKRRGEWQLNNETVATIRYLPSWYKFFRLIFYEAEVLSLRLAPHLIGCMLMTYTLCSEVD